MKMKIAFVVLVLGTAFFASALMSNAWAAAETPQTRGDLIRQQTLRRINELADIQKTALQQAGAFTVQLHQKTTLRGSAGETRLDLRFEERREGAKRWISRNCLGDGRFGETVGPWREQCILAVGDSEVSYWPTWSPTAYLWNYANKNELPSSAKSLMEGFHALDFSKYAYGFGSQTIAGLAAQFTPDNIWLMDINEPVGIMKDILIVLMASEGGRATKLMEIEVDPTQGYLVTFARLYSPDGEMMENIELKGKEYQPGLWLPSSWHHVVYGPGQTEDGNSRAVVDDSEVTVDSLTLQQNFDPAQFTLLSLGVPNGTEVLQGNTPEATREWLYFEGALISREQYVQAMDVQPK